MGAGINYDSAARQASTENVVAANAARLVAR